MSYQSNTPVSISLKLHQSVPFTTTSIRNNPTEKDHQKMNKMSEPKSTHQQESEEEEEEEEENIGDLIRSSIVASRDFLQRHSSSSNSLLSPRLSLKLESLLSSASISLNLNLNLSHNPNNQEPLFHTLISNPTDTNLWRQTLRLSNPSFALLLRLLPSNPPSTVAASLFRLAHAAPYSSLRRRFLLPSSAAASHAFFSFLKQIPYSLPLPSPSASASLSSSFPPSCLALRRIRINGFPSGILVQALVDSSGRFSDVSVGWPGTLSPDAVLHQTRLFLSVEESLELLTPDSADSSYSSAIVAPQHFVLGDSCFPLLPWLLTPYGTNEKDDPKKIAFNDFHSRAMSTVRSAFQGMRSRWRILDREWKEECVEYLPFVVVACCLLHNFAVDCNEPPVEDEDEEGEGGGFADEEEEFGVFDGEVSESGERVRDAVAAHLARECSQR